MSDANGHPTLPPGWAWATLSDLTAETGNGFGRRKQESGEASIVLRLADIRNGDIDLGSVRRINAKPHEIQRYGLHRDDLLAIRVNGSADLVGRMILFREANEPVLFCDHFIRLRLHLPQMARYVRLFADTPSVRTYVDHNKVCSAGQNTISQGSLRRMRIPLPPPHEQRRIVAKIEELFTDLNAGMASLERVRVNLKRYRAAVLKAAVEGRLTEKWRRANSPAEPASKLLDRILLERRKKWEEAQLAKYAAAGKPPPKNWRNKYEQPAVPDTTSFPNLPAGWCWASVEQLSIVVRGASPRPAGDPRYFGGSHTPWITVGALTADDDVYLRSVSEFVTQAGRNASRYIEPDTLLLTNSGATLGVPKVTLIGGCINDGSVALLGVGYPLKLYLYYFLTSQTTYLRAINQGAAQPNLNTGIVKRIMLPLPPDAEQQQVVAEVERRLSVAKRIESGMASHARRASCLRQSILKRAFDGKLVSQDPDDEPAITLLNCITSKVSHSHIHRKLEAENL